MTTIVYSICIIFQISEWIRGSKDKEIEKLHEITASASFGIGSSLQHSIDSWRALVKQSWLSGLLDRDMRLAKGHNKLGGLVINTYHINHRGRDFLDSPTPLGLPAPPSRWGQKAGDEIGKNTKKQPTTTR